MILQSNQQVCGDRTESFRSPPHSVTAWDSETIAKFDRDGEDILILDRQPLPGISEVIETTRVFDWRSDVTSTSAERCAAEALDALRISDTELGSDIVALSRSFLAQFEVEQASLRVEVVNKQSCPKFHCDNVRIRLVTTYYGPTTEYVHNSSPEQVRSAPLFSLVFLKGHKHPGYTDTIHHRSPEVPPSRKRMCVVLDV